MPARCSQSGNTVSSLNWRQLHTLLRRSSLLLLCVLSSLLHADVERVPSLAQLIPLELDGYQLAPPGSESGSDWSYRFPADYAAHSDYRSELWQWHLQLTDETGQKTGVSGRLVRLAVAPPADRETTQSAWAFSDVYLSLQSLAEPGKPVAGYQSSLVRGALNMAGVDSNPDQVWVRAQRFSLTPLDDCGIQAQVHSSITHEKQHRKLQLTLESDTCPVTGSIGGASSIYGYLQSVEQVTGVLDDKRIVEGSGWIDRVWGELPVGDGPVVADQFRIRLANHEQIIVVRTRRRSGKGTPQLTAYKVPGNATEIQPLENVEAVAVSEWQSPQSGKHYATQWRVRINADSVQAQEWVLIPEIDNQEVNLFGEYRWTGIVRVEHKGKPLDGSFAVIDVAELPR